MDLSQTGQIDYWYKNWLKDIGKYQLKLITVLEIYQRINLKKEFLVIEVFRRQTEMDDICQSLIRNDRFITQLKDL